MAYYNIVRSDSFWWDDALTFINDITLVDNMGHIVASADYHIFPAERRCIPTVVHGRDGIATGIHLGGKVYYLNTMALHLDYWYEKCVINGRQHDWFSDIIRLLVEYNLAWDLTYFWPNTYMPHVSATQLQCANIGTFLDQFPSDPYVIALDSETVETFAMTSLGSISAELDRFDWEDLNEAIDDIEE